MARIWTYKHLMECTLKMRQLLMLSLLFSSMSSVAMPSVAKVTAKQRYPWNGMVDITCEVSGISGTTNEYKFRVSVVK